MLWLRFTSYFVQAIWFFPYMAGKSWHIMYVDGIENHLFRDTKRIISLNTKNKSKRATKECEKEKTLASIEFDLKNEKKKIGEFGLCNIQNK